DDAQKSNAWRLGMERRVRGQCRRRLQISVCIAAFGTALWMVNGRDEAFSIIICGMVSLGFAVAASLSYWNVPRSRAAPNGLSTLLTSEASGESAIGDAPHMLRRTIELLVGMPLLLFGIGAILIDAVTAVGLQMYPAAEHWPIGISTAIGAVPF